MKCFSSRKALVSYFCSKIKQKIIAIKKILSTVIDLTNVHVSTDTINSTNQSWVESQKTNAWASNNPNLTVGECVGSRNGQLVSVDCLARLNFVCEKYETIVAAPQILNLGMCISTFN